MAEQNYWVIIPPPVVADKTLPSGAKLVFGRIFALMKRKGYCYASNEFLGKDIGLTKKTVSAYISMLKNHSWLRVELIRDKTNRIKERRIFTYLSNSYRGGMLDPIQLKLEKSNERVKNRVFNKKMKSLKETMKELGLKKSLRRSADESTVGVSP